MRIVLWGIVLLGIGATAAWLTRPKMDSFDALLKNAIENRIATTDIGAQSDAISTIALVGCKLRPSDCFDLIRNSIEVRMEDRTFYTRFTVTGFGRDATCTGIYTKLICSGGFGDE